MTHIAWCTWNSSNIYLREISAAFGIIVYACMLYVVVSKIRSTFLIIFPGVITVLLFAITAIDARDVNKTLKDFCSKSNSGCHMGEYVGQVAADAVAALFSLISVILIAIWNSVWIDEDINEHQEFKDSPAVAPVQAVTVTGS